MTLEVASLQQCR